MSKLLRLPLTLLAVLAALFFLPGVAFGDPLAPTAEECAADPSMTGCLPDGGGDVVEESGPLDEVTDPPGDEMSPPPAGEETQSEEEQSESDDPPGAGSPAAGPAARVVVPGPRTQLDAPVIGAILCDADEATPLPPCPESPGIPGDPLSCDELADLLNLPECPSSFSCEDLADLLGITCPEGPPSCEVIAELFGLEGCPEPPTSCQEFADLLGIDNCEGIPCLDTSQLPAEAREGLAPLLDGLEAIGIKECPPKPATGGGGTGGGNTPPPQGTSQPPPTEVHYANCDDARARGAAPVYAGQPGYRAGLDSDNDGIGCEDETQYAATSSPQPTGTLAYTGYDLESQLTIAWTLLMAGAAASIIGRRRA
jgi:hypothetical protein